MTTWLALAGGLIGTSFAADVSGSWWKALLVRDLTGRSVAAPAPFAVLMFLDPECPVANGYLPVMTALAAEFSPRGFAFIGAYADPSTSLERLRTHARDFKVGFQLVDDRAQLLARFVGAKYSAETVVLGADGSVLYRGRIDDRVGANGAARPAATRHDLHEVLQRLASGERGPFHGEPGFGCALAEPVQSVPLP